MNVIYGRYLLAATWYKTLFGKSVTKNPYIPSTALAPNAVCNEQILNVVKEKLPHCEFSFVHAAAFLFSPKSVL